MSDPLVRCIDWIAEQRVPRDALEARDLLRDIIARVWDALDCPACAGAGSVDVDCVDSRHEHTTRVASCDECRGTGRRDIKEIR